MAANTPELMEAHFGVPMAGGVLNALNTRLDPATIAFILEHGEAKVLIADREFSATVAAALGQMDARPLVIDIDDPLGAGGDLLGEMDYEAFLETGDPDFAWALPDDEWQAIALNYTSGTTGNPKGVVYHHRGAYLNAMGNVLTWALPYHPIYLWTLPMFHCNGWCFPWTITAMAGTHVCLRRVEAKAIYDAIADHKVTHLCGAPIVMGLLLNAPEDQRRDFDHPVRMMTAASAPPAAVLEGMAGLGFDITHVYGLTEVYGPATVCAWNEEWNALPPAEQATHKSRQGVTYPVQEGLIVADPETIEPVPPDGETIGEVFMRGNITMKGYLKNPTATEARLRRRLVPHRRSRRHAPQRLYRAQGPLQGHHHLRRREHLHHRGRRRPLPPPLRPGSRRGRQTRRQMGRNPLRLRDVEAGCGGHRSRHYRLLPRPPGPFQMPEDGGVRRPAEDVDGQDPEIRAAGPGARVIARRARSHLNPHGRRSQPSRRSCPVRPAYDAASSSSASASARMIWLEIRSSANFIRDHTPIRASRCEVSWFVFVHSPFGQ